MNLQQLLTELNACSDAREWVGEKTIEQAIQDCHRGDWIGWLADKLELPKQIRCLAAGHAANTVRHLMEDERSLKAADIAIAFGEGKATEEELKIAAWYARAAGVARAAAEAAEDAGAARTAAIYAALAARYAAEAAGVAGAAAADENQRATAEIYRKYLGQAIIQKVNEKIKPPKQMITATQLRQWLNAYDKAEISFSRLLELVNGGFIPITDDNKPDEGQIVWVTDGILFDLAFRDGGYWMKVYSNRLEIIDGKLKEWDCDELDFTPTHFHPTPDFSQFKKEK